MIINALPGVGILVRDFRAAHMTEVTWVAQHFSRSTIRQKAFRFYPPEGFLCSWQGKIFPASASYLLYIMSHNRNALIHNDERLRIIF